MRLCIALFGPQHRAEGWSMRHTVHAHQERTRAVGHAPLHLQQRQEHMPMLEGWEVAPLGMPAGGAYLEREQVLRWAPRRCRPGQAQVPAPLRQDAMAGQPAHARAPPAGAPGRWPAVHSAAGRAQAPLRALAAGAPGQPWVARLAVGHVLVPTAAVLLLLGLEQLRLLLARVQKQVLMPAWSIFLRIDVHTLLFSMW